MTCKISFTYDGRTCTYVPLLATPFIVRVYKLYLLTYLLTYLLCMTSPVCFGWVVKTP